MAITSIDRPKLVATPTPFIRPLVLWVMRLATVVAAGVSGYLASISLTGAGSLGCSGGFDCEEVLNSAWATWFGVPVSLPALSLYVSLLIALGFSGPLSPENVRSKAWTISLALCCMAGAAALWFLGLQLFAVGAFCSWCLTIHMCGIGLAALALFTGRNGFTRLQAAAAVALSGVAVLAVGQIFGPHSESPKLERVATLDNTPATDNQSPPTDSNDRLTLDDLYAGVDKPAPDESPVEEADPPPPPLASDDPPPPPSIDDLNLTPAEEDPITPAVGKSAHERRSRIVSLFRGRAQVDVYQHPVLGSPEAPYIIVKLFDYTCSHCRMMHEHLQQARAEFGDKLAIVMCPVPLNKQCNPQMQFDNPKHAEACDLARLALAVWQADRAKFAEFDAWLFAPPVHPSVAASREKAIELVGETKLAEQLYSDQLRERLAVGPKLYKLVGAGTVPKLLLPTGMLVGPGDSTQSVMFELKREFTAPTTDALP